MFFFWPLLLSTLGGAIGNPLLLLIGYPMGSTNWIYPDPDTFVSHAKMQGAMFLEEKTNACATVVRRVELPKMWGPFSMGERENGCGNVVRSVGLLKILGPSFWRTKNAGGIVVRRVGLP